MKCRACGTGGRPDGNSVDEYVLMTWSHHDQPGLIVDDVDSIELCEACRPQLIDRWNDAVFELISKGHQRRKEGLKR